MSDINYEEAELEVIANIIKEDLTTWGNFIVQVAEDNMEDNELVQQEVGLSPVYITAATLEQMRQGQGWPSYERMLKYISPLNWENEYLGTWPDLEDAEPDVKIWHLNDDSDIKVEPQIEFGTLRSSDIQCGADLSIDEDITVVTEWCENQIIRAYGLTKEQLESARSHIESLDCDVDWRIVIMRSCVPLCTPSRTPITGGAT